MEKFCDALNEFQKLFSTAAYGMTIEDALDKGICVKCKTKINPEFLNGKFFTYYGLCKECFDNLLNKEGKYE